ncbi:hypothetical protein [Pseudonocardia pini]|uniref:hypothetical protein n=1 Tax=Pseudonocardia pini TaxID=2758030 RepID=UPI0015F0D738|nr:hypothetical protein [Pseudonocardia pini]
MSTPGTRTPSDRSPAESTTYLQIPPSTPSDAGDPASPGRAADLHEGADGATAPSGPDLAHGSAVRVDEEGPSTKILEPLAAAPPTIPALPLTPRDPADRPFADPRRSVPGKPDTLLRRLFRRSR